MFNTFSRVDARTHRRRLVSCSRRCLSSAGDSLDEQFEHDSNATCTPTCNDFIKCLDQPARKLILMLLRLSFVSNVGARSDISNGLSLKGS